MTNNTDFVQVYLSEMARHEVEVTLLVTITVGVVALIFATGVFLVWRENRAVLTTAQGHLASIHTKREEIDAWYLEKKASLDRYLGTELEKFNLQIEEIRCYQTLVMALQNTGEHAALIFPALCVLAERPCALYVGVFHEIIRRHINNDITERAELGLKKWGEMQLKK